VGPYGICSENSCDPDNRERGSGRQYYTAALENPRTATNLTQLRLGGRPHDMAAECGFLSNPAVPAECE